MNERQFFRWVCGSVSALAIAWHTQSFMLGLATYCVIAALAPRDK